MPPPLPQLPATAAKPQLPFDPQRWL